MGALIWFVRILVLLLLLRFVLRLLFGSRQVIRRQPTSSDRGTERAGGELVRDPQCGTYIPKSRAIAVGTGEGTRYFCSTTCRDTYEKLRTSNSDVRS